MNIFHESTAQRPRLAWLGRSRLSRRADRDALSAERIAAIVATVLIHAALLVGLRAAMVQRLEPADAVSDALQVVILPSQPRAPSFQQTDIASAQRRAELPSTLASIHDARDERTIRTPPFTPPAEGRLIASIYNPDGSLRLPADPAKISPRDLLTHRDVDHFLPGASDGRGPDFHIQDDPSPRDVLVGIGQCVTAAHCVSIARAGQRGVHRLHVGLASATASVFDPCPKIERDLADPNRTDPALRERWMRACVGR